MKKYIFTESQIKKIVDDQINEQNAERSFILRVQKFLNEIFAKDKTFKPLVVDGKTGPNSATEAAIMKLQSLIKLPSYENVDGVWGSALEDAMKKNRPDLYKIWESKYKPGFFSDFFD